MNLRDRIKELYINWTTLRRQRGFRSVAQYFVFVIIAALFWFMLALNDSLQDNVDVKLRIYNVPDSATFITLPPSELHITVRDKGTSLLRASWFHKPVMNINFKEYASEGVLRLPPSDLYAMLRSVFGPSAQISSISLDSLHLNYTTNPGRKVPVEIRGLFTPADGFVIMKQMLISNRDVMLYSNNPDADTISKVYTTRLVRRDMSATEKVAVPLASIPGVRMIPDKVNVTIQVETLVKKKTMVSVDVINVPVNESLLIFPANVEVTYFVPMSKFNEKQEGIEVSADYRDIQNHRSRMPISVERYGRDVTNVTLLTDSVEYTIVRQ